MSFFCPKCGTQLPDGANVCSNCGTPIGAAPVAPQQAPAAPQQAPQAYDPNAQYAQQPYPQQGYPQQGYPQAPYGAVPVAPKQPANFDLNVGGFCGDFFKSPVDAVTSRGTQKYWLMALIFAGSYAILEFILALIDHKSKAAKWGFYTLLTDIFAIAAFVVIIMLMTAAFKIKKMDFLSSLSLIGLPFALMFACRLVEFLNTKIYTNIDKKGDFFSISSIIAAIGIYFIVIMLYDFALNANPGAVSKGKAVLFAIVCVALYLLLFKFFDWMFYKIFDMKNAWSASDFDSMSDLYAYFG
ncbi:MAG: zinc ribbon domain-containing protein [Clostridiales bacterium]|nr:zinc ribbon domain-containing protein [Clostridiales bacterium]